jgi:hypothetical protein
MHSNFRRIPTSYYGVDSGVAVAIQRHPNRLSSDPTAHGLNIGIIGLGVGTIATYGTSADTIQFYEINPDVERVARKYFHYLDDGKAATTVVLGDARISMQLELENGGSNEFDVLIMDAFSGDAVPVHLLTEEAFDLYEKHLSEDGILAAHISNEYLELSPLIRNAAQRLNMDAIWIEGPANRWYEDDNDWVLISRNQKFLNSDRIRSMQNEWNDPVPKAVRWTDDFSNLLEVIDWGD